MIVPHAFELSARYQRVFLFFLGQRSGSVLFLFVEVLQITIRLKINMNSLYIL